MKYTIDSTDKSIGRVASEAATVLMGKKTTGYARNIVAPVEVHITNAARAKIGPKKMTDTVFRHHTGYRGNLKGVALKQFIAERGYRELFRKTVYGMLPRNKLRPKMIKNLYIFE